MRCHICNSNEARRLLGKEAPQLQVCAEEACARVAVLARQQLLVAMPASNENITLVDFPPEILLNIVIQLGDDMAALQTLTRTHSYLGAIVRERALWWRLNENLLSEIDLEDYKTDPRSFTQRLFQVTMERARVQADNHVPSRDDSWHKTLTLIFSIRKFLVPAGHVSLAKFADHLRERTAASDQLLSSELLAALMELTRTKAHQVDILPAVRWMTRKIIQFDAASSAERPLAAFNFEFYMQAIEGAMLQGAVALTRILVDALDQPHVQLSANGMQQIISPTWGLDGQLMQAPLIQMRNYQSGLWSTLLLMGRIRFEQFTAEELHAKF